MKKVVLDKQDIVFTPPKKVKLTKRDQERNKLRARLFRNIQRNALTIVRLKESCEWWYEDRIYRFYHTSFKVYQLQEITAEILKLMVKVSPYDKDHFTEEFNEIMGEGRVGAWKHHHNKKWTRHTRPIVEAFFHAKFVLDMMYKTLKLSKEPNMLPSGWAAILEIYKLRY